MSRHYQHFLYRNALAFSLLSVLLALGWPGGLIFSTRTSQAAGTTGLAYAWGNNSYGKLGNGTTTNSSSPVGFVLAAGVTANTVTGGNDFSLAIGSDNKLYAWGYNADGELGDGTNSSGTTTPKAITLANGVTPTAISAGNLHSLAIGSDNKLYAWGYNGNGRLGNNSTTTQSSPVVITLASGVTPTAIKAGFDFSMVIGSDNKLYTWGNNSSGQLGDGGATQSLIPKVITLTTGVTPTAIAAAQGWGMAIGSDNKIYTWGSNAFGQLGDGGTTAHNLPAAITLASGVTPTAIAATGFHALAIGNNGKLYTWGYNAQGQLGNGTTTNSSIPLTPVLPNGVTPSAITSGFFHTLLLGSDGKVYTWGRNDSGQLGNGTTANVTTPTAITLATGVIPIAVAAGYLHSQIIAALPTLSISSVSQNEGNSGTTSFVFTATLSFASVQTATVSYATSNGTATAGSDYTATSGTLTFAPGTTTQAITVTVNGDATDEPNETFLVTLSSPSAATLATSQGTGAILNDDYHSPVTFINPNTITINDSGKATPYPSSISVAGVTGNVNRVTASIYGISHTYINDVDILLVGPGGQHTILMADVGGTNRSNINLTFDDTATNSMFDSVAANSGTYKPSNTLDDDFFPSPAPAPTNGTYPLSLSVFNGIEPNGTWKLYVFDDNSGDAGQIANGWALTFYVDQTALIVTAGNYQTATVGTPFPVQLQATLKDAAGNALSGQSVTFTAPGSGASGAFANSLTTYTANTNSSGVVTASLFTANTVAGTYLITATSSAAPAAASFGLTNLTGAATSLSVSSGNAQSTIIGTTFAQPLAAKVTDTYGNPISSATITFTAPASGASGKFANNQTVYTGTTDASGVVTTSIFTANSVAGSYSVVATTSALGGSANVGLTNLSTTPVIQSGNNQEAILTASFAQPLVVVVRDGNNNPVSSAIVTFTAPSSGASGKFANNQAVYTGTTNASGVVTTSVFTANSVAGSYAVTATTLGASTPASFNLANLATIVILQSGTNQQTNINAAFGQPLVAMVRNSNNIPVSSAIVTFTAPSSGASGKFVNNQTVYTGATDASGLITTSTFTANGTKGSYTVNATTLGTSTPASFSLTNLAPPSAINVVSGSGQNLTINTALAAPLVAKVTDSSNNPVSGASVTFSSPDNGASGTFAGGNTISFGTTDASGLVTAPAFTANSVAGSYTVKATVSGVVTQATFSLTNTAGAAANLVAVSGGGQSASVGAIFGAPLVVQVTDAGNNPVSGTDITFNLPTSGPSGIFADGHTSYIATTDASGRVTSLQIMANSVPGSYTVSASASGGLTPVSFNLTNTNGSPSQLTIVSGNQQTTQVNNTFIDSLVVAVTDQYGNPLSNTQVSFTAHTTGASVKFAGGNSVVTVTTGANGQASSPTLTANTIAGSYNVTVTVSGIGVPTVFNLTNTAGAASSLSLIEGNAQSTVVNTAFAIAPVVQVADQYGNPVSGTSVKFSPPTTGASGSFANSAGDSTLTVISDNTGKASATIFTANTIAGAYSVNAAVAGVPSINQVNFNLTNLAGPANIIITIGGTGQATTVNNTFSNLLVVSVADQYSNPVSATQVRFSAPSSGASANFSGGTRTVTVTTGANGQASSPTLAANSTAGSYSVTATVQGLADSVIFNLTNLAGCNPLLVTSTVDDGSCGTLRAALSAASTGSSKQLTITLAAGSTITLTTGITLGSGISITTNAACTTNGPAITIQGSGANSGNGLVLSGGNSIYGLWVKGFNSQQIVASGSGGNIMYCVKSSKT